MKDLSHLQSVFLQFRNPSHRRYEALRALCVEQCSLSEAAQRCGYSPAYLGQLLRDLEQHPDRDFFLPSTPGRKPDRPPPAALDRNRRILQLRRDRQLSILEISAILASEGFQSASKSAVARVLRDAGIPKLPRRRPGSSPLPLQEPAADRRSLDLSPRVFQTRFGGLFLFARLLAPIPLAPLLSQARWPGSSPLPALNAVLSLLALKLSSSARHSHVSSSVSDPGLALFAGLNRIPKRSTLTEYSCRVDPRQTQALSRLWLQALHRCGLPQGDSFDLDFHTIPYHGKDALVGKHYVSKRSRKQKGLLAFLARDADSHTLCFAKASIPRKQRHRAAPDFADWWRLRTGKLPAELVFDSTFTTRAGLRQLHQLGIRFLTLRRRTKGVLAQVHLAPDSDWRRVELHNIGRRYRHPRVLDQQVSLPAFPHPVRQIAVTNLGHERLILLITNQLEAPLGPLLDRYARRMLIENAIAEAIHCFHMDALSSKVPQKIDVDLQLTLMASGLYRLLARTLGGKYATARASTLSRKFVQASARVEIGTQRIQVRIGRRAYNPVLIQAGLADTPVPIPWLNDLPLQITFL